MGERSLVRGWRAEGGKERSFLRRGQVRERRIEEWGGRSLLVEMER